MFSLALISVFLNSSSVVSPKSAPKNFIGAEFNLCLILCFKIQLSLLHSRATFDVVLYNRSFVSFVICLPALLLITSSSSLAYGAYSSNSASFRMTVHADLSVFCLPPSSFS
jgi:hypothetical protein